MDVVMLLLWPRFFQKEIQMKHAYNCTFRVAAYPVKSRAVRPGLAVLSHTLQWTKYSIVGNVVWASCMLLCLSFTLLTSTDEASQRN